MESRVIGRVGCEACDGKGEVPVIEGRLDHLCECAVQIDWDGQTVWVNNDAHCIGRYSAVAGVDIHDSFESQMKTGEECLDCKPGFTGDEGWKMFVDGMLKHHRIVIPETARPADDDRWAGMIEHPSTVEEHKASVGRGPLLGGKR